MLNSAFKFSHLHFTTLKQQTKIDICFAQRALKNLTLNQVRFSIVFHLIVDNFNID